VVQPSQPIITTTASPIPNIPSISKEQRSNVVSGFSIKSVHVKTEHQKNNKEIIIDPNSLPKEPFTQEAFQNYWDNYIEELLTKGERIQASILKIANLKLDGTTIDLEVSSNTAKIGILNMEHHLLDYLHRSLRNYDINIQINVNEEIAKKIAVTPEDKYERLLEENPLLQDFKNAFSLMLKP
jgi:DNA polymerase III, subunits gamma and tau